jgi:hypothetical protein
MLALSEHWSSPPTRGVINGLTRGSGFAIPGSSDGTG